MIFLFKGLIFRFKMLIFQGANGVKKLTLIGRMKELHVFFRIRNLAGDFIYKHIFPNLWDENKREQNSAKLRSQTLNEQNPTKFKGANVRVFPGCFRV